MENVIGAFQEFPKMARLSREVIITEKIDGTNAQIFITAGILDDYSDRNIIAVVDGFSIRAGSRNKWIIPGKQTDNAGFAAWVKYNAEELVKLGEGRHFGEWWGQGIQRGYNMKEKVFSLFNVERWVNDEVRPKCCRVVPELWRGNMDDIQNGVNLSMFHLREEGSKAAPGFMDPEGIIIYHTAANICFKKTIKDDDKHKSQIK